MWWEIIQIDPKLIQLLPFTKIAGKPGTRKKCTTAHRVVFSSVVPIRKYLHIQCSSPQVHQGRPLQLHTLWNELKIK